MLNEGNKTGYCVCNCTNDRPEVAYNGLVNDASSEGVEVYPGERRMVAFNVSAIMFLQLKDQQMHYVCHVCKICNIALNVLTYWISWSWECFWSCKIKLMTQSAPWPIDIANVPWQLIMELSGTKNAKSVMYWAQKKMHEGGHLIRINCLFQLLITLCKKCLQKKKRKFESRFKISYPDQLVATDFKNWSRKLKSQICNPWFA